MSKSKNCFKTTCWKCKCCMEPNEDEPIDNAQWWTTKSLRNMTYQDRLQKLQLCNIEDYMVTWLSFSKFYQENTRRQNILRIRAAKVWNSVPENIIVTNHKNLDRIDEYWCTCQTISPAKPYPLTNFNALSFKNYCTLKAVFTD